MNKLRINHHNKRKTMKTHHSTSSKLIIVRIPVEESPDIVLHLRQDVHAQLAIIAAKRDRTLTQQIIEILARFGADETSRKGHPAWRFCNHLRRENPRGREDHGWAG